MDEPRAYVIPLVIWPVLAGALITHWSGLHPFAAVAWVLWLVLAMIALLAQTSPGGRAYLAGTLQTRHYTQVYLYVARPLNDWVWRRVGRMRAGPDGTEAPPPETTAIWHLLRGALTWRLLDRALLIAVAYPLIALILPWLLGGDAVLGAGVVVFPAAEFWPERALVLGQFVILTGGFVGLTLASASPRRFWRSAAEWLPLIAIVFASAGVFAVVVAVVVGVAFAVLGAVAVAVAVDWLWSRGRRGWALALLGGFWALGLLAIVLFLDLSALPVDSKAVFIFLAVLPLINGLFDALSYALTLALSRKGLATRWAPLWGLIDLALGAVLFLALGATMVAVIAALNAIGTAPIYDLAALFAGLRASPGDYWWLYLILFSTLLPTALHLLIAALAVQGWFLFQRPRRAVAGWIAAAPTSHPAAVGGFLAQATIWWLPLIALAGLGWVLWQVIGTAAGAAGLIYLDALEGLSRWIGVI
ncbi:hypothetical protein [Roseinatronobacter monicus]|uniref:Uncharacterized protein n=1 Tax=Roseinatronobacter monicus TaxID=393481 RepID=A0A543K4D7_9RHOB|nr:hypothetical protein [Roseinatronobacter monicus]TQM89932.1 hypothetical protein BD293_4250 [Roseinatronobacter monicus]